MFASTDHNPASDTSTKHVPTVDPIQAQNAQNTANEHALLTIIRLGLATQSVCSVMCLSALATKRKHQFSKIMHGTARVARADRADYQKLSQWLQRRDNLNYAGKILAQADYSLDQLAAAADGIGKVRHRHLQDLYDARSIEEKIALSAMKDNRIDCTEHVTTFNALVSALIWDPTLQNHIPAHGTIIEQFTRIADNRLLDANEPKTWSQKAIGYLRNLSHAVFSPKPAG